MGNKIIRNISSFGSQNVHKHIGNSILTMQYSLIRSIIIKHSIFKYIALILLLNYYILFCEAKASPKNLALERKFFYSLIVLVHQFLSTYIYFIVLFILY